MKNLFHSANCQEFFFNAAVSYPLWTATEVHTLLNNYNINEKRKNNGSSR